MSKPVLYDDNPDNDIILQGDIFSEIDFFLTTVDAGKQKQISEKRPITIVSQTCDISDNDFLVVSPIYTIEEYIQELNQKGETSNKISSNVGYIKSRKGLFDRFYLENLEITKGISKECFVDLRKVNTLNKGLITIGDRIASLSHWGRQVLNYQLMWVYGRPVTDW